MRALAFGGNRSVTTIDIPDPTPGLGEVVIEIKASGMCGSDLHYYRSATGSGGPVASAVAAEPVIAGHEPCGVVAAVGPGVAPNEARVGQRVMVHHYWGCSACEQCRSGWAQMCTQVSPKIYGVNAHGAHAPYLKVPARTVVPLPDELSFEAGAAISCGTGTAYFALRRLKLSGRETIAIFGQGPVGLAATQLAVAQGARVIALDINADRLQQAKAFGADATLNPMEGDPVAAIKDLTHGGADMAMDTSGASSARAMAIRCVRLWGSVSLVGAGGDLHIAIAEMMRRQITIMTSWTFSNVGQAECARFVARRGIDVDRIFTHRWSLDQGEAAYRLFDQQNAGKGVFRP